MKISPRLVTCLLTCSLLPLSVGCRAMRPVSLAADPAAPAFASIKVGETVDVETRAGKRIRFVVREVERDAIVSVEGARYTRAEIVQVKRRLISAKKTGWLAAGLLYLLAIIVGEVF
jgi:hypothetical protein